MKALTLTGYDGLASMRFAEVAVPEPGPNDVLVAMRAATVDRVDGGGAHRDQHVVRPGLGDRDLGKAHRGEAVIAGERERFHGPLRALFQFRGILRGM